MDIRLIGVSKRYGRQSVLDGIDLSVPSGGVVVIQGSNGSGKTTLLEILSGLVQPDKGEVYLGGRQANALQPFERGIFYVPQSVHKFWALKEDPLTCYVPNVPVRENLRLLAGREGYRAEDFLDLFGLYHVRNIEPAELSRGQKQRLALARAFMSRSQILLLDEPLASIDPRSRPEVIETLIQLQQRDGRTAIYITQHPEELAALDARRILVADGQIHPVMGSTDSMTSRLLRRTLRGLLAAMVVDTSDKLEAFAVAGRRPSDMLEWVADRLRARRVHRQRRLLGWSRFSDDDRRRAGVYAHELARSGEMPSQGRSGGLGSPALDDDMSELRREIADLRGLVTNMARPHTAPAMPAALQTGSDAALRQALDEMKGNLSELRGMVTRTFQAQHGTTPSVVQPRTTRPPAPAPVKSTARPAVTKSMRPPIKPRPSTVKPINAANAKKPGAEWQPPSQRGTQPAAKRGPRQLVAQPPKANRRVAILRMPSLVYNYHGIPPFGLATITGELQLNGYDIVQDDLDGKCAAELLFPRHRWGKDYPAKNLMADIARIRRFWDGAEDADVVSLVEKVLSFTDIEGRDTVMLSCIEGDDYSAVLALCIGKYLREFHHKTVILGGEAFPHMQPIKSEVAYFYERGCFDFYIQGYGEVPLVELFGRLEEGRPVDDVPGLVYLQPGGQLIENPPLFTRPEVIPDFDGLPMDLYYKQPDEWGNYDAEDEGVEKILVLPVKLNYCCPNKCAFCISSGDAFTRVTWMDADAAADSIGQLKSRYNTPYFMFADDLFNVTKAFADNMADAFIRHRLDIMWSDCAYGRDLDKPLLEKLRRAGCVRLVFGLETGSVRMQKFVNKGIDLEEFESILKWSHEAGIYNAIQIISGLPHEQEEDIQASVEFLKRNRPYLDQVFLNPFSLITGSLMHKQPQKFGITDIETVATIFQTKPDEVYSWIQRYTFNEINGLKWADKVKQIEHSYRIMHETQIELGLGGHDIHTLFQRFTKFGEKRYITDFQTSRAHQGFDYFA